MLIFPGQNAHCTAFYTHTTHTKLILIVLANVSSFNVLPDTDYRPLSFPSFPSFIWRAYALIINDLANYYRLFHYQKNAPICF